MTALRAASFLCTIGIAISLTVSGARAQELYRGNDTGGLISWSCEAEWWAPRIAAEHCAQYNKYPRITGVQRHPGDFISFACLWAPNIEPSVKPPVPLYRATCAGRSLSVKD
jgi:hypothetical protein